MSKRSEIDQSISRNAFSRGMNPCDPEPQIVTDLGLLIFKISNKLSKGNSHEDNELLSRLGNTLKTVSLTSSSWKGLLTAGRGPTSMSLIEQLFHFSITVGDVTLAEMMLQIGADPNWKLVRHHGLAAIDFAVRFRCKCIIDLLLKSGAVYSQTTLMHAISVEDFDTADRMLHPDSSVDLNFNYINEPDPLNPLDLGPLKVETVTLLGLTSFSSIGECCHCCHDEVALSANEEYC